MEIVTGFILRWSSKLAINANASSRHFMKHMVTLYYYITVLVKDNLPKCKTPVYCLRMNV